MSDSTVPATPVRWAIPALLLGNLCLVFGPIFVRMADVGPVASGFWRVGLAALPLFLIARAVGQGTALPSRALLWAFVGAGLFFAADLAAWHLGIMKTKLANSALLANSSTFLFPLWGFIVARAWPSRNQGLALGLAGVGAVLLMGQSFELSPDNLIGDLLCFAGGAFYTGYLIIMARVRTGMGQWPALAWATLMCVAPLGFAAWAFGEVILPTDWTPVIALSFFSQILGQGLMIYAIGGVSPLVFGLLLLMQPIISATLGWAWYGEALTLADFAGAALIALALILVRRPEPNKKGAGN